MQSILALGTQDLVDLLQNLAVAETLIHHLGDLGLQGGRHGKERFEKLGRLGRIREHTHPSWA